MKRLILVILFSGISKTIFSQTGTILIKVDGIDLKKGGVLAAGIFNEKTFPKVGKALFEIRKSISDSRMEIIFETIPAGDYGIAVFQDVDNNNNLKTNLIGFPIEPIGFSNDARIKLGPPSFADARVKFEPRKILIVNIQLH